MDRTITALRARGPRAGESGVTLVEMMVALLVLGVILSATAASLITFSQQAVVNEHRVQATAYLNQLHERLQALPFNLAVHYEDEVPILLIALQDVGLFPVDLDPSDEANWSFEGRPLVVIENCPDCRDARVPPPVQTLVDVNGRDFQSVLTVVTWDASGTQPTDLATAPTGRRFTTIVSWEVLGRTFSQRFESLRAPTATELDSDAEPILVEFLASPLQIDINTEGRPVSETLAIGVTAVFRRDVEDVEVSFPCLTPNQIDEDFVRDEDGYITGEMAECTETLTSPNRPHRDFVGSLTLPLDRIWVLGRERVTLRAVETATGESIPARNVDIDFITAEGAPRPTITSVLVNPQMESIRQSDSRLCAADGIRIIATIANVSDEATVTASFEVEPDKTAIGRNMTRTAPGAAAWELRIPTEGLVAPWQFTGNNSYPTNSDLELVFTLRATNPAEAEDGIGGGLSSAPVLSDPLTLRPVGNC